MRTEHSQPTTFDRNGVCVFECGFLVSLTHTPKVCLRFLDSLTHTPKECPDRNGVCMSESKNLRHTLESK